MPKPRGSPKSGGRKAGTPNKLTADVRALMNQFGFDPIKGMMMIAADLDVPVAIRGKMFAELAQYVFPKRRAIELSGADGSPIEVNVNSSALQSLEDRLDGIAQRVGASGDAGDAHGS